MYYDLLKIDKEMDMTKYSLKDLALYFEKFDGYICEIKTDNRILKFMFDINSFPHLIGLHHAFKGKKNRNEYKGAVGFEKIKNGEITYNDIMKGIKNGHSNISWVNIKNRIKYLPMFLNRLSKAKLLIRKDDLLCRKVFLKGNYFLYRSLYQNNYPILSLKDIVDVNKTLGEYYKVTIGEEEYYYFIAKDSSKMRTPVMNTVDALTDISIKTDSSEVPLDSKINTVVIDAKSDEYKEFLNKVNINNGLVVDLKLFSDSINKNISKLENGVFKVYVPLNDELRKLDLTAYYVKDNGEIEKHDVKIEGDYLVFETDHFSTYVIGGNKLENPATLDNVSTWIITTGVSLLGLAGAVLYKRKFNN